MIKRIKHFSYETAAILGMAFLIYFIPVYTALILNGYVGYVVYKRGFKTRAWVIFGTNIFLILIDNLVKGQQDVLRANLWAWQAVLYYLAIASGRK